MLADLLVLRCEAQNWFGTNEDITRIYEPAFDVDPRSPQWAHATYYGLLAFGRLGRFDQVKRIGARIDEYAGEMAPAVRHGLRGIIAWQAYIQGDVEYGDTLAAMVDVNQIGDVPPEFQLVAAAAYVGRMHQARLRSNVSQELQRIYDLQRFIGTKIDRWTTQYATLCEALVLVELGRPEESLALLDRVHAEASSTRNGRLTATALEMRAAALLSLGEFDRARRDALGAYEVFNRTGDVRRAVRAAYRVASAALEQRDFDACDHWGAVTSERASRVVVYENLGHLARVQLATARGEAELAARLADAAHAGVSARGEAGELMHPTRLAIVEAWLAVGRTDDARALAARARSSLLAALEGLPDPSWRAQALARVPEYRRIVEIAEQLCGPIGSSNGS